MTAIRDYSSVERFAFAGIPATITNLTDAVGGEVVRVLAIPATITNLTDIRDVRLEHD